MKNLIYSLFLVTLFFVNPAYSIECLVTKGNIRSNGRLILSTFIKDFQDRTTCPSRTVPLERLKGNQGEPGPIIETLASGNSLRGIYSVGDTAYAPNEVPTGQISFPFPLSVAPSVEVLSAGDSATTNCPGTVAEPEAAPGYLCIYESSQFNRSSIVVFNDQGIASSASPQGVGISILSTAAGLAYSAGTWAVTAH